MQALRRILGIRWYDKVSNAVVNERTKLPNKLQTSFIIWSHLSPTREHTCFAGTATVNRSPHRHSSCHWLEAPAGSSTKKLAATSERRHWPICWCCLDRGPGSFDVEDATILSWSSATVSEWVWNWLGTLYIHNNTKLTTKLQFLCGQPSTRATWPFDAPVLRALWDQDSTYRTRVKNYPGINIPIQEDERQHGTR